MSNMPAIAAIFVMRRILVARLVLPWRSLRCSLRCSSHGPFLLGLLGVLSLTLGGCKDLTGSAGLPAGTPNPSFYNNPAGAIGMRNAAVLQFELILPPYIIDAGLLTDELEDVNTGASTGLLLSTTGIPDPLDERILPEVSNQTGGVENYNNLQGVREYANQAIGALATYDTSVATRDSSKVLRGELYAIEGYVEILLADLFCSGVPLSTLDFQKDFTYAPGSSTTQVYQAAIAKFDTALAVGAENDSVVNLARVGRGRAFLALGQYAAAAAAVAAVPTGFRYDFMVTGVGNGLNGDGNSDQGWTIADHEGINGLPFLSGGDLRMVVDTVATTKEANGVTTPLPVPVTIPTKYSAAVSGVGYAPFTLADGLEARLIDAEAQLQPASAPSGPWLATLNQLRVSAGLPGTLTDPGAGVSSTAAAAARIALLFRERAYWLFMTGHRQGDLRRLLRQYGQNPAFNSDRKVYPTGVYLAPGSGAYGTDVTVPIPTTENANPLYHGCHDRNP